MVSTEVRYTPLDPNRAPSCCTNRCPKLSRLKCAVLIIFTILLISLYTCFHQSLFSSNQSCFGDSPPFGNTKVGKGLHFQPHAKHTQRHLPQCIIIGVRKAGTRALLNFLSIHPLIQISSAEVHFFDDDDNFTKGLDWYRKRMPYTFKNQITIEKTPKYFTEEYVPERIYKMNSSIKLLLIVRNPVQRAVSDFTQLLDNKRMRNHPLVPFEDLATDDDGEIKKSYPPVRRSIYHRYMIRWLNFFSLDQFHFIDGDKLISDPYQEVYAVETFLNLPHEIKEESFYFNRSRGFYCIRKELNETCLASSKGRKHPDIDKYVLKKLRIFYEPYNEKFFKLIGRRFKW